MKKKTQSIHHLTQECSYQYWHRMLFARFLAENHLLIHPDLAVPVTLEECEELAEDEKPVAGGKMDKWVLAGRFAAKMLPQIFRPDDPVLQITFAPEHHLALEKLLESLSNAVFIADDGLGWVYQFWQSKRKDEVNASEKKIGADELPAVTQLFTEDYMVDFLLDNTLGAWHAGKDPRRASRIWRIRPRAKRNSARQWRCRDARGHTSASSKARTVSGRPPRGRSTAGRRRRKN